MWPKSQPKSLLKIVHTWDFFTVSILIRLLTMVRLHSQISKGGGGKYVGTRSDWSLSSEEFYITTPRCEDLNWNFSLLHSVNKNSKSNRKGVILERYPGDCNNQLSILKRASKMSYRGKIHRLPRLFKFQFSFFQASKITIPWFCTVESQSRWGCYRGQQKSSSYWG